MYTIFSAYLVGPGECHKLCDLTASQCARHVIETTTIKEEDVTVYSSYFVVTTLTALKGASLLYIFFNKETISATIVNFLVKFTLS